MSNPNQVDWPVPEDLQPIPRHDPIRKWIDPKAGTWTSSCGCGWDGKTFFQCLDDFLD